MTAHLFIKTPVTDPERYQEYVRARPSCVAPSSALPSARPGRSPACGEEAAPATGTSDDGRYGGPSWDPSRTCIVLRR